MSDCFACTYWLYWSLELSFSVQETLWTQETERCNLGRQSRKCCTMFNILQKETFKIHWGKKDKTHCILYKLRFKNVVKEIVYPKMKMWGKCTPGICPGIQNVDEFVSSTNVEKCNVISLAHQRILCSECVLSEWFDWIELIKSWLKHHNYPKVIKMTPVHQLTPCEAKSCGFVINKSIIKSFLFLNGCFRLKYKSSIHNIAFSGEKVIYSELRERYAQIKHCLL